MIFDTSDHSAALTRIRDAVAALPVDSAVLDREAIFLRVAAETPMRRCLIDAPVGPSGVSEILHAAVHEAGHAVIARAFGIFGGGARIYLSDEGVGGNTTTAGLACLPGIWSRSGKHSRRKVALRAKIIIAAAGGEAELLMYGWMRGDDVDRRNIELLLARLPDGSQYEKRLRRIARHLARRHRVTIERVADVLAEKLELTGSEIDALMPPAWIARYGIGGPACSGDPLRCDKCS